jgi:hypothetical protein
MALLVDFTGGSSTQSGCTAPDDQKFDVGTAPNWDGLRKVFVKKARLDTSATGGTNTDTDVYRMIAVPAGTLCLGAWIITVTAETSAATATIALGDGDGTAGYLTATVPSTTVDGVIAELYNGSGAYRALAGRFYRDADTIDVLVGTAAFTDGVYDICALLVDLT